MSLKIGITGGIGVGKTFCCRIFEILDIPIYYADLRAKLLMVSDQDVKSSIIKNFGEESYTEEGELNRTYLAKVVFGDKEKTKIINQIVHPAVGLDLINWFNTVKAKYGLYEAALMYESGSISFLDKVIVVDAPEAIRVERIKKRDGISNEEIKQRMSKQMPQKEKVKKADYVIINDNSTSLIHQILNIHQDIMKLPG